MSLARNHCQLFKSIALVSLILILSSCREKDNSNSTKPAKTNRPEEVQEITPKNSKQKVEKIADETTVKISGRGRFGSGVIINKKRNTYYVLTSRHVVGIKPGALEDKYKVITHDDQEHDIIIEKSNNLDLAILKFKSGNSYQEAKLNPDISLQQIVYISGGRDCQGNTEYEFNQGEISAYLASSSWEKDLPEDDQKFYDKDIDYPEGYIVKYTNSTIDGMSGSPIFDENGDVVAIHGKAGEDRRNQYNYKDCPPLNDSYSGNWGIPISKFLSSDLASELP